MYKTYGVRRIGDGFFITPNPRFLTDRGRYAKRSELRKGEKFKVYSNKSNAVRAAKQLNINLEIEYSTTWRPAWKYEAYEV